MHSIPAQQVGHYLVTPMTRRTDSGTYAASVSVRRGVYDRIFRLVPVFGSAAQAADYALVQGRRMALAPALG